MVIYLVKYAPAYEMGEICGAFDNYAAAQECLDEVLNSDKYLFGAKDYSIEELEVYSSYQAQKDDALQQEIEWERNYGLNRKPR